MTKKKALFGYGGHAKEVAAMINEPVTFFVDDNYSNKIAHPISSFVKEEFEIMIAVGESSAREKIVRKLLGFTFFTFVHPTAVIGNNVKIGEGSYIGPYSIITCDVEIGNHSILNRINTIGHDSVCGNFLSMMPGSIISGNCKLGNNVYLGSNSTIKEKINICDNVTIGLNSGVVKNIIEKGVYIGTPTKKIK